MYKLCRRKVFSSRYRNNVFGLLSRPNLASGFRVYVVSSGYVFVRGRRDRVYKMHRRNRTGSDRCVGMYGLCRRNRTGGYRRDQLYGVYRRKVFIRGCDGMYKLCSRIRTGGYRCVGMYGLCRRNRTGGYRRDQLYGLCRRKVFVRGRCDGMFDMSRGHVFILCQLDGMYTVCRRNICCIVRRDWGGRLWSRYVFHWRCKCVHELPWRHGFCGYKRYVQ
jgi:hypothetical protein